MRYLLIISTLFLTSCSSIQVAFFLADRLIASRVGKSFDLNSQQEGLLRKQINSDLNFNKVKIGTQLDQILLKIETMAKSEEVISFEEFSKYDILLTDFRFSLVSILKPSIDQFISHAKDKNVTYFGQNIETNSDQKKIDGFESLLKFFLGSISDQQTQLFQEFLKGNSEFYLLQAEARKDFSSKILEKKINTEKTEFIFLYLTGDNRVRSKEYAESYVLYKNRAIRMWYELWNSVTSKQKKVLIKNLEKYRSQIQETFL